jgi:hypothetical protein
MTTYPEPVGFDEELLRSLAAFIAAEVPYLSWYDDAAEGADAEHVYGPSEWGIYTQLFPEGPEPSLTLSAYAVSDDASLSDSVIGVQASLWHPSRLQVGRAKDDLFNLLHGRQRTMLGTVTLVSALRSSGTNVGQDSTGRLGRTENYYLTVHRPSANRQ